MRSGGADAPDREFAALGSSRDRTTTAIPQSSSLCRVAGVSGINGGPLRFHSIARVRARHRLLSEGIMKCLGKSDSRRRSAAPDRRRGIREILSHREWHTDDDCPRFRRCNKCQWNRRDSTTVVGLPPRGRAEEVSPLTHLSADHDREARRLVYHKPDWGVWIRVWIQHDRLRHR